MKSIVIHLTFVLFTLLCNSRCGSDSIQLPEPSDPFEETIFLNLDLAPSAQSTWQLCHAELDDSIKPFVILSNTEAENLEDSCYISSMKFKVEPFLGNQNFYKILCIKKNSVSRRVDNFNLYDVDIVVGLNNETCNDVQSICEGKECKSELSGFTVTKETALDYHVKLTPKLQEFIDCNLQFSFNKGFLNEKLARDSTEEIKICCGAICASRFIF